MEQKIIITETQKNKLIAGIKKLLSKDKIMEKANVSYTIFEREVKNLIKLEKLPQKDYDSWLSKRRRQRECLNESKLEQMIQMMEDNKSISYITSNLIRSRKLSKATIKSQRNKLLARKDDLGERARKVYVVWLENYVDRRADYHINNAKKITKRSKKIWKKYLSNPKKLKAAGKLGGKALQKKIKECPDTHGHLRGNLFNHFTPYGQGIGFECDGIFFQSKDEAKIAYLLLNYSLIKEINYGKNYQITIGRKTSDFFIVHRRRKIIVEYHPPVKGHDDIKIDTKMKYIMGRTHSLRKAGYDDYIVILTKTSDFYYKLLKYLGYKINKKSHKEYMNIVDIVDEKLGIPKRKRFKPRREAGLADLDDLVMNNKTTNSRNPDDSKNLDYLTSNTQDGSNQTGEINTKKEDDLPF